MRKASWRVWSSIVTARTSAPHSARDLMPFGVRSLGFGVLAALALLAPVASAELSLLPKSANDSMALPQKPAEDPMAVTEDEAAQGVKLGQQRIRGTLTTIRKRYVNVEVINDEGTGGIEYHLPLSEATTFDRVRSVDQLQPGDVVEVTVRQKYRDGEDGTRVRLGTVAEQIRLVKSASEELTSRGN
jgi:hypothetical protein